LIPANGFYEWKGTATGKPLSRDCGMAGRTPRLLKPYDAKTMRSYPVSTPINHVGNDDEECPQPVVLTESQNRLFA